MQQGRHIAARWADVLGKMTLSLPVGHASLQRPSQRTGTTPVPAPSLITELTCTLLIHCAVVRNNLFQGAGGYRPVSQLQRRSKSVSNQIVLLYMLEDFVRYNVNSGPCQVS